MLHYQLYKYSKFNIDTFERLNDSNPLSYSHVDDNVHNSDISLAIGNFKNAFTNFLLNIINVTKIRERSQSENRNKCSKSCPIPLLPQTQSRKYCMFH